MKNEFENIEIVSLVNSAGNVQIIKDLILKDIRILAFPTKI